MPQSPLAMNSSAATQTAAATTHINTNTTMPLRDIQFMHRCRDNTCFLEYSSAQTHIFDQFRLVVVEEDRQLLAQSISKDTIQTILIFASSIRSINLTERDIVGLFLELYHPPPLREYAVVNHEGESAGESSKANKPLPEKKLTHLTPFHKHIAPFTWSIIRLVFFCPEDLRTIQKLNLMSNLPKKVERYSISTTKHFYRGFITEVNQWFSQLPWGIAFECAALLYNLQLCAKDLLELKTLIENFPEKGQLSLYIENVVRQLGSILRELEGQRVQCPSVQDCFMRARQEVDKRSTYLDFDSDKEAGTTKCYHVNITPFGFNLHTLSLDMSNRVLRTYPNHHDSFLRVSFADEQGLSLRFQDQKINKAQYIAEHMEPIMRRGFRFIGRNFQYLHYSHSSLKELTFWFIRRFEVRPRKFVDADTIRTSIGLEFPGQLTRYPARFGARLSQAFTATNASETIQADEIEMIQDVERPIPDSDPHKSYCFTDGVGCFSSEMGMAIHRALLLQQGRIDVLTPDTALPPAPSVYQIRIGGAKGIITLHPLLPGRVIHLRPSMEKFKVPHLHVEVARSFNHPAKVRLNRPLITILHGRGVSTRVFMELQRETVSQAKKMIQSFENAGNFLETQKMGVSFGLPKTLQNLYKLSMEHSEDPTLRFYARNVRKYLRHDFMARCLDVALYHVLRNLKYKAQIPVPQGWKVVGTIDECGILEPGEIFVPIAEDLELINVEGKVLIYKSPVIHPGDVQVVTAVSRQSLPVDCPLLHLRNCVVFSQKGDRPLPNQLSGSDLDGDMYDIVAFQNLFPRAPFPPMDYNPQSSNKELEHDCRVDDIIDFVLDFILNDTIGLISTNFLRVAEESGLYHPKCQELARLHSRAVDYSKTGLAVQKKEIPFPRKKAKPDYLKPELEFESGRTKYYRSKHVLGRLYRGIELPDPLRSLPGPETNGAKLEQIGLQTYAFYEGVTRCIEKELRSLTIITSETPDLDMTMNLINYFVNKMQYLGNSYILGLKRYHEETLSEQELFLGTILAKTFDYHKREEDISSLREETGQLARKIWIVLKMGQLGASSYTLNEWINRAWSAWMLGLEMIRARSTAFGLKTFMFVVLSSLFAAIKEGKNLYV